MSANFRTFNRGVTEIIHFFSFSVIYSSFFNDLCLFFLTVLKRKCDKQAICVDRDFWMDDFLQSFVNWKIMLAKKRFIAKQLHFSWPLWLHSPNSFFNLEKSKSVKQNLRGFWRPPYLLTQNAAFYSNLMGWSGWSDITALTKRKQSTIFRDFNFFLYFAMHFALALQRSAKPCSKTGYI